MIYRNKCFQLFMHLVVLFLALACIIPFLLLFSSSITSESSLTVNGYSLIPGEISLAAYDFLWTTKDSILRAYGMSFLITATGTAANLILTFLFAYPLSRKDLPGRRFISFFLFFTMLFNGGFVSTYLIYSNVFHINDTLAAMIVPYLLMNAFYVIMVRTYIMSNVPDEVLEAARIDGSNEFQNLIRIVIPMSRPILATVALMSAIGYWNNWTNGVYFITTRTDLYGIQNFLNSVMNNVTALSSHSTGLSNAQQFPSVSIRMALAVIAVIPVLIAYPFFQKSFVKGITIGSVKG
ncbi:MAG TPA: carbohydrate ABC transporter permease [Candidatus Eisenbergiella merdigallinarum]|uniref:Carbohydrate ABC transporter permease n=1 Tax=Candidatus Eisenbergiella merdigallinarum TaxID=2838552 RepID=A0A9D2MRN5_9FIRM|nr:carbohydrate ABC transporter permease [Candidatus Eisenbergiella merdigallinarum]